jgi:hypothetical protein
VAAAIPMAVVREGPVWSQVFVAPCAEGHQHRVKVHAFVGEVVLMPTPPSIAISPSFEDSRVN